MRTRTLEESMFQRQSLVAGLLVSFVLLTSVDAEAVCPVCRVSLSGSDLLLIVEKDCLISGDFTLAGSSRLDLRNADTVIKGDLVLQDDVWFVVVVGSPAFGNDLSRQHEIRASGNAITWLTDTVIRTQTSSSNNMFVPYYGFSDSTLVVVDSTLPAGSGSDVFTVTCMATAADLSAQGRISVSSNKQDTELHNNFLFFEAEILP